jgi:hypothetical protein
MFERKRFTVFYVANRMPCCMLGAADGPRRRKPTAYPKPGRGEPVPDDEQARQKGR